MIRVDLGARRGGKKGRLLSEYTGNIGELFLDSIGYLIGALIATVIMMIYTVIKNRKESYSGEKTE